MACSATTMSDLSAIPLNLKSVREARRAGARADDLVAEACRRAQAVVGDGIFTALVPPEDAVARAHALQRRADGGESLPLLGVPFAVKDNIHVAGMVTTSNCPGLSIMPEETAHAVQLLEQAGAVLIGKNTMDQFATGLNGTRSPEPLCRNAIHPNYIPGGSSSGSAVAVARDIVAFSLGSDTGGSGRVPAACNGIVGLKPTIGLVSSRGLLYNNRFLDCVPIFARSIADAYEVLELIAAHDSRDPFSRPDAGRIDVTAKAPSLKALATPRKSQLRFFGDADSAHTFEANLDRLVALGFSLTEIDFDPFEEAGRLVFQSAMVAERLCDYGDVIANRRDAIHPAVWAAIEPGLAFSAKDAFQTLYEVKRLQRVASNSLAGFAALVVPTIPTIFTIEEMLAEPMGRNTIMGTYTYFVNPLDLCAVSVPGVTRQDGLPSALCFAGRAGEDGTLRAMARSFEAALSRRPSLPATNAKRLRKGA
ncbi:MULTISPECIES: allophanate hydrolase [unclassified Bradyrhizobium]|uniref:allophanate hydrolase n=1 Tax=unclassified Bradyrhizobium TaxID=2631580 RepID=UPI0028A26185|nr:MULTISPECIES: allophanate hydrolase [unclassified Bradyrhizobium]